MAFITAEQAAVIKGSAVRQGLLVELRFSSKVMRLWNGAGTLDAAGYEWTGAGDLGSIDGLRQIRGAESGKVTLAMSGVSREVVRLAKNEVVEVQGRLAFIWQQLFYDDWKLLGPRIAVTWGIMQRLNLSRDPDKSAGQNYTASLEIENPFAARSRPPSRRYTDADHQSMYPGDKFCRFAPQDATIVWPDF